MSLLPLSRLALFVLLLNAPGLLSAQAPLGAIEGQVTDASGAAVPGATVTVTASDGSVRTSTTDTQGRYRIGGLAPASYTVRSPMHGFALFNSPAHECRKLRFKR